MVDRGSSSTLVLVLTTEANTKLAEGLANELLARRLVACVSLQQIQSHYCWQGELERAQEVQLLIKTSQDQLDACIRRLESYTAMRPQSGFTGQPLQVILTLLG